MFELAASCDELLGSPNSIKVRAGHLALGEIPTASHRTDMFRFIRLHRIFLARSVSLM